MLCQGFIMKKIFLFLVGIAANIQGMEQPAEIATQEEIAQMQAEGVGILPVELVVYLFSFIPNATSIKDIFNQLAQLSLVNREFQAIAKDQPLITALIKRYIQFHPVEAKKELDHALDPGNGNVAKALLNAGILNKDQILKDQTLMKAADKGSEILVELLIDNGAQVDEANRYRCTALMCAVARGHKRIVELLLDHGASIDAVDSDNYTALMHAAEKGHKEIVQLLVDHAANNVNAASKYGNTALILAASNGLKDVVNILLAAGADVNARDRYSRTAMMRASRMGHTQIVELLESYAKKKSG